MLNDHLAALLCVLALAPPAIIYLAVIANEPRTPPVQARADLPRDLREELNAAYERIWRR